MSIYNKACIDIALPHEWYPHALQSELFGAGLRIPVIGSRLGKFAFEGQCVPTDASGICYIPGVSDEGVWDSEDDLCRGVIESIVRDPSLVCALITPPLATFDNDHLFGARIVTGKRDGQPFAIAMDHPPKGLRNDIRRCMDMAIDAIVARAPQARFKVLGARLNKLCSGLQNVLMILEFEDTVPFHKQEYLQIPVVDPGYTRKLPRGMLHSRNLRARVIPSPSLSTVKAGETLCLRVEEHLENHTFTKLFEDVQDAVSDDIGLVFRYLKLNRDRRELQVCMQYPEDITPVLQTDSIHDWSLAICKRSGLTLVECSNTPIRRN
jgi:hypothetical protein